MVTDDARKVARRFKLLVGGAPTSRRAGLLAVIPSQALSEAAVARTVADVSAVTDRIVLVHNDPSPLPHATLPDSIEVLQFAHAIGKTDAIRAGLKLGLADPTVGAVLQIDGRAKQSTTCLPELVDIVTEGRADMAIYDRYGLQPLDHLPHRRALSTLMSRLVQVITGYTATDTVCGTRAYTRELAEAFLNVRHSGYGLELEQLMILGNLGGSLAQVAVASNQQDEATSALKLSENFEVVVDYARRAQHASGLLELVAEILWHLKHRLSFELDLAGGGIDAVVKWHYTADGLIPDAYSLSATGTFELRTWLFEQPVPLLRGPFF